MEGFAVERVTPVLGLAAIMGLAWLIGDRKRNVSLRIVLGGLALQFALALFILKTWIGVALFSRMGEIFTALLGFVEAGSLFVFGEDYAQHFFAFQLLPTIIFTSAVMSVLFHLGVLQRIVAAFAWTMRRTLGTSGAESFAAAANVFVGQTEAPLMVRPYINGMTRSELMSLMTGGFATIAGSLFVVYASMGVDAGHLIGASVISAPAALLIAKLMIPETEHSLTLGAVEVSVERSAANVMDALTEGAQNGLRIALNVAALLIAIIAIVAMLNALLTLASGWVSGLIYGDERWAWTIQAGLGYAFAPFGWLMGVPWGESLHAGQLLGRAHRAQRVHRVRDARRVAPARLGGDAERPDGGDHDVRHLRVLQLREHRHPGRGHRPDGAGPPPGDHAPRLPRNARRRPRHDDDGLRGRAADLAPRPPEGGDSRNLVPPSRTRDQKRRHALADKHPPIYNTPIASNSRLSNPLSPFRGPGGITRTHERKEQDARAPSEVNGPQWLTLAHFEPNAGSGLRDEMAPNGAK